MKVRIQNDGQKGYMTKVTNAETGEVLDLMVTELTIKVFDDIPHAILTSVTPVVDVIADAEIKHICACCGKPMEEKPNNLQTLIDAVKAWEEEQGRTSPLQG